MTALREMTEKGEIEFNEYINSCKDSPDAQKPDLNRQPYSVEFRPQIDVDEQIKFKDKLEMAEYLNGRLSPPRAPSCNQLINRKGVWTWLAYIWFDQLTIDDKGKRIILENQKYVCDSSPFRYYRHLVLAPFMIYCLHGRQNSLVFLAGEPLYTHGDFIEQVASRSFIINNRSLIEAISRLYLDPVKQKRKDGATNYKRPGTIRRFVSVIQQLELTYYIHVMETQEILDLLPNEFDEWKGGW